MTDPLRRDMKITGSGNASGGIYDKVRIIGDGGLKGDVDCHKFICTGTANVSGNMRATMVKIRGMANISGNLTIQDLRLAGAIHSSRNLICETMKIWGEITVKGDCETERLYGRGSFNVGGLLNAGIIDMQIGWPSKASEIGGEIIRVKRISYFSRLLRSLNPLFKSSPSPVLHTNMIEGDDIYLEFTKAKIVRGNRISIGPGCEIEQVEYRNDLNLFKHATVGNVIKI